MSLNTLQNVWDGTGARPARGGSATAFVGPTTPATPLQLIAAPATGKRLRILRLFIHASVADSVRITNSTPATLHTFRVAAGLNVLDFDPLGIAGTTSLSLLVDATTATLYVTALYLTDDSAAAT